jgi:hypothetical protein
MKRGTRAAMIAAAVLVACGARTELDGPLDASPRDASTQRDGIAPRDAPADACGSFTLDVPVGAPWFDTGIDIVAAERLRITATGVVRYGGQSNQVTDANGGNFDGQMFFSTAVLPNTVVCSLVGKVGGTTAMDTGTPLPEGTPGDGPGFVGVSYDRIVPVTGRLFLGFNDQRQAFGDNGGSFTVTITLGC